ncbi:MAG: hypothetical protein JWP91_1395 [Fibrobacteres bacterium]|nr:hypothetical protein [Fibrobacterota bacterium]
MRVVQAKHLLWSAPLLLGLAHGRAMKWRKSRISKLHAGSRVIGTSKGPMEYGILGDGKPVLVLHGTPGGYDQGLDMARLWTRPGIGFLAVSRPGYLRTPLDTGRDPEEQADAYAAFLDAMGIETLPVIGVSGGGPSAIQFAARHPGRVSRLLLVEAVSGRMRIPLRNPVRSLMESDLAAWAGVRLAGLWQGQKRLLGDPLFTRMPDLLVSGMESMLPLDLRKQGIDNDVARMNALAPLPFDRIRAPTLLIHGRKDTVVPFSQSLSASKAIPRAKLLDLPEGNHVNTPLNRDAVAAIGAFLAEV